MTPAQDPQIDPVSVLVVLLGIAISAEVAQYVAPYIVIGVAGLAGSAFALSRAEPEPGYRWVRYVLLYTTLSMLFTVPASYWLHDLLGVETRWLLAVVSGSIAGVGHDWPNIGRWAIDRLARMIDRKAGASE